MEALKARGANPCATVLPSAWTTVQLPAIGVPLRETEVTFTMKVAAVETAELVVVVVVVVELVVAELVELAVVVEEVVELVVVVVVVMVVVEVVELVVAVAVRALATAARYGGRESYGFGRPAFVM
jgi:hypothetical protein